MSYQAAYFNSRIVIAVADRMIYRLGDQGWTPTAERRKLVPLPSWNGLLFSAAMVGVTRLIRESLTDCAADDTAAIRAAVLGMQPQIDTWFAELTEPERQHHDERHDGWPTVVVLFDTTPSGIRARRLNWRSGELFELRADVMVGYPRGCGDAECPALQKEIVSYAADQLREIVRGLVTLFARIVEACPNAPVGRTLDIGMLTPDGLLRFIEPGDYRELLEALAQMPVASGEEP